MSFSSFRIAAGFSLDDIAREFHVPPMTVRELAAQDSGA
jgi:hypothetical protein